MPGENPKQRAAGAWSISTYLILLACASTIPLAVVVGFAGYNLLSSVRETTRSASEDRLALFRNGIELRIANVVEDLQILAQSPSLQRGDIEAFRDHAIAAVRTIDADGMVLVDRAGQQVMSTIRPRSDANALPKRTDLATQERVFETGRPQVSDLILAAADGRRIISVEVPVTLNGEIKFVLAAGLSPKYLSSLMQRYVPEGMIGSIIDRQGILIARQPYFEGIDLVGKPTIPEVAAHLGKPAKFWIETTSRAGVPFYSSLLRSDALGWYVNLAVSRETIDGELRRSAFGYSAIAIAGLGVSLTLAWIAAARIKHSLASLGQEVVKLGGQREITEPTGPITEINRMQAVLREVSTRIAETEEKIEDERSLLRTTVDSIPVGVLLVTREGRVYLANRKMQQLWDINTLRSLDDPDQIYRYRPDGTPYPLRDWPITRALRQGQQTESEEVLHRVGGMMRNIVVSATPVRNSAGAIIAAVSTCYDVTEIRDALTRQQILLDEINHRVKNTLASVQSIARLTAHSAESINDYLNAFEQRLFALSSAYNLLTENNWEGADLSAVVRTILAPFSGSKRALIKGPALMLSPKIALAFSAAIQELSTNAAKYGSLSNGEGNINVSWNNTEDGMINFSWIETGGPPVQVPKRRGFGMKLIQDILAADSGWTVRIDYIPTGLKCNLRVHGQGASI